MLFHKNSGNTGQSVIPHMSVLSFTNSCRLRDILSNDSMMPLRMNLTATFTLVGCVSSSEMNLRKSWLLLRSKSPSGMWQSFTLWEEATIEITRRDHSIIACSRHVHMGVVLHPHPVRGESQIWSNASREVATLLFQCQQTKLKRLRISSPLIGQTKAIKASVTHAARLYRVPQPFGD